VFIIIIIIYTYIRIVFRLQGVKIGGAGEKLRVRALVVAWEI